MQELRKAKQSKPPLIFDILFGIVLVLFFICPLAVILVPILYVGLNLVTTKEYGPKPKI